MDYEDRIRTLADRAKKQKEHISTEEATKTALVMPFIAALDYDIFNPLEVIPEYTADIGTKKGEKVDYAIKQNDKIIMLIECKWHGCDLNNEHASQLFRYFSSTEARFGILTNGLIYRFFSDLEQPNKMDERPFYEFNILNFESHQIDELKKFTKHHFSLEDIITTASTLKYTGAVKKILGQELLDPSESFVRFFASQIYDGKLTKSVLEQFKEIVKDARNQFINNKINDRLKSVLAQATTPEEKQDKNTKQKEPSSSENAILRTEEEMQAYYMVKAILRASVASNRIYMRDHKNYRLILLDNTNRKPICRLYFSDSAKKQIMLFNNDSKEKLPIRDLNDIFSHAETLLTTIDEYENKKTSTDEATNQAVQGKTTSEYEHA